jgi:hypothetical protein
VGSILADAATIPTGGTFNGDALAKGAVTVINGAIAATALPVKHCNQGVYNGPEFRGPGKSKQGNPLRSNDELGATPSDAGRRCGNNK